MANILPRLFNIARFSFNNPQLYPKQGILSNSLLKTVKQCSYSSQPTPYEIVDEGQDYKVVKGESLPVHRSPFNIVVL